MIASMSLITLWLIFGLATIITWVAGIHLSNTTDTIDTHFGFGEALGGMILLSFATNLPEIAIVISAALTMHMGIAIGNILGGIAIQTVVLVVLDGIGVGATSSLTYQASSPQLVLEGVLVIAVLVISIMGTQLPPDMLYSHFAPPDLLIVFTWLIGVWLVNRARSGIPWKQHLIKHPKRKCKPQPFFKTILIFTLAAIATLIGGVFLEMSGSAIAGHIGWSGVVFGSTVLAAVTALPEVSTGLAAVKLGDYTLAYSDIFGGNAFLPTLFLPATLISDVPILPQAQSADIYLASLGALLTAIYICGLIFKSKRQWWRLGYDSLAVLCVYIIGIIGLFAITHT